MKTRHDVTHRTHATTVLNAKCSLDLFSSFIKMPSRCVAAGCDHKDNQLYEWPKDASLARRWTNFVKTKRDKWSPSARSVLCSKHFKDECFLNVGQYRAGLSKRSGKNCVVMFVEVLSSRYRHATCVVHLIYTYTRSRVKDVHAKIF